MYPVEAFVSVRFCLSMSLLFCVFLFLPSRQTTFTPPSQDFHLHCFPVGCTVVFVLQWRRRWLAWSLSGFLQTVQRCATHDKNHLLLETTKIYGFSLIDCDGVPPFHDIRQGHRRRNDSRQLVLADGVVAHFYIFIDTLILIILPKKESSIPVNENCWETQSWKNRINTIIY